MQIDYQYMYIQSCGLLVLMFFFVFLFVCLFFCVCVVSLQLTHHVLRIFFLFRGNTVVEVSRPLNPDGTFYKFRDNTGKEMVDQFIGDVLGCAALIDMITQ